MRVNYIPVCLAATSSPAIHQIKLFLQNHAILIKIFIGFVILISLYITGVLVYVVEDSYINFKYPPYDIEDIRGIVDKIDSYETKEYGNLGTRQNDYLTTEQATQARKINGFEAISTAIDHLKTNGEASSKVYPLTQFKELEFLIDVNSSCSEQWKAQYKINSTGNRRNTTHSNVRDFVSIIVIVKSAVNYFERRESIRKTWYLNGMIGSYNFKTVFFVGACDRLNPVPAKLLQTKGLSEWTPGHCREAIAAESKQFGDIIQSSGIDSYYNNTVKTFMTLRWIHERCATDFALAIDDDYVVEIDNFLDYVGSIAGDYIPSEIETHSSQNTSKVVRVENKPDHSNTSVSKLNQNPIQDTHGLLSADYITALQRLSNQYFWSGFLLEHVRPLRSYFSKWYITYEDYSYDRYPTYLTGGMHLMSLKTARHLYYGTYFTEKFKFDDVYLGIVAERIHIQPKSKPEFKCTIEYYLSQKPLHQNATLCSGVHDISAKSLLKLWEIRKQLADGPDLVEFDFNAL